MRWAFDMESRLMKKAETFEEFQNRQPISDLMGVPITKTASFTFTSKNEGFEKMREEMAQISLGIAGIIAKRAAAGKFAEPNIPDHIA